MSGGLQGNSEGNMNHIMVGGCGNSLYSSVDAIMLGVEPYDTVNGLANIMSIGEAVIEQVPKIGMAFKNKDEVFQFYQAYGRGKGFGIVKRGVKKDEKSNEEKWMTLRCSKGGVHKSKGKNPLARRGSRRVGCKARICCTKREGLWVISSIGLDHNHEISPQMSRFLRQHRRVDEHLKMQLEINDRAGICPSNNVRSVIAQAGGYDRLPCLKGDLSNQVQKFRRLQLVGGDAEAVNSMFVKMQTESKDFLYVIKHDKEGRMKHLFWVDGRCRAAYREFRDVITFDTTYLVNRYQMPFAAFVGVNHHGHSILLGSALLNNEKAKTYKWLFEKWLKCMDGKHPDGIMTDQCGAIGEAIKIVFPNTRHRWCWWHIACKIPKKLAKHQHYNEVREAFTNVVKYSMTCDAFDENWQAMVSEFNLERNEWINNLFENRNRWAPAYMKPYFWAGMSSTQRSESMHAFFNKYVHSRSTLRQFVEQYQVAIEDKVQKEVAEDNLNKSCNIPCVTRFPFEEQLQKAYTINIFKQVQKQLTEVMYCNIQLISEDGKVRIYGVSDLVKGKSSKTQWVRHVVKFEVISYTIACNCQLFESMGYLCSHSFNIFIINEVGMIPSKYILRRWRKDVERNHSNVKVYSNKMSTEMLRTKELENIFYAAVNKAVVNERKFEFMLTGLEKQNVQLEEWTEDAVRKEHEEYDMGTHEVNDGSSRKLKDPVCVKRRGRPKCKRQKGMMEKGSGKRQRRRPQSELQIPCAPIELGTSAIGLLQQANEGRLQVDHDSCIGSWWQKFVHPQIEG